jgi:hypothetical protein
MIKVKPAQEDSLARCLRCLSCSLVPCLYFPYCSSLLPVCVFNSDKKFVFIKKVSKKNCIRTNRIIDYVLQTSTLRENVFFEYR